MRAGGGQNIYFEVYIYTLGACFRRFAERADNKKRRPVEPSTRSASCTTVAVGLLSIKRSGRARKRSKTEWVNIKSTGGRRAFRLPALGPSLEYTHAFSYASSSSRSTRAGSLVHGLLYERRKRLALRGISLFKYSIRLDIL